MELDGADLVRNAQAASLSSFLFDKPRSLLAVHGPAGPRALARWLSALPRPLMAPWLQWLVSLARWGRSSSRYALAHCADKLKPARRAAKLTRHGSRQFTGAEGAQLSLQRHQDASLRQVGVGAAIAGPHPFAHNARN